MRSIFPDNTEISCLPVDQRIKAHQEGRAQNEVRMHWCDTQRQIKLHGRHLDLYVNELCAWHTIAVGSSENLATVELVASLLQLTGHSFGDEVRTGSTVD